MNQRQYTHATRLASEYSSGFFKRHCARSRWRAFSSRPPLRVVRAPGFTELVADLADGDSGPKRITHQRKKIGVALGPGPHLRERLLGLIGVPLDPHLRRSLELAALRLRIEAVQLDRLRLLLLVAVDADDHLLAGLDRCR